MAAKIGIVPITTTNLIILAYNLILFELADEKIVKKNTL